MFYCPTAMRTAFTSATHSSVCMHAHALTVTVKAIVTSIIKLCLNPQPNMPDISDTSQNTYGTPLSEIDYLSISHSALLELHDICDNEEIIARV